MNMSFLFYATKFFFMFQSIREDCWTESELSEIATLVRSKLNQERGLVARLRTLAQVSKNEKA